MKPEEVLELSYDRVLTEAERHPGAAILANAVITAPGAGLGYMLALGRLQGWLMRHLAEPEKGESERLLEALVDLDGSLGPGSRGWSVYPPYGEECGISEGEGATPLEALRAAFPEASVSPAPVVPAPAAEEQDQKDDNQDGGGAHG